MLLNLILFVGLIVIPLVRMFKMSDFPKTDAAIIALSDALDVLVTANKALKDSIATADDVISGDVQAQVDKVTAAAAPPAA